MASHKIDPLTVDWPQSWQPVTDESVELGLYPRVTKTITEELRREMATSHPLYGVECIPLAVHGRHRKEVLFATSHPDMPLAVVHFTGVVETRPEWPFVIPYSSLEEFCRDPRR